MSIRLHWSGGSRNEINFGDTLSPLLVEMLLGKKVVYADPSRCDLAAIGSILQKVQAKKIKRLLQGRLTPVHVWGAGSFGVEKIGSTLGLKVHAVRGVLTREALKIPHGLPLGDPGLLIDRFGTRAEKRFRWGIIPHVSDRQEHAIAALHAATSRSCIIDLADPDIIATIVAIQSCDFIISSSLHGLIAADALGIPNIWIRVSSSVFGGDWKFLDYFSSVGRSDITPLLVPLVAPDLTKWEPLATYAEPARVDACRLGLEASLKAIGL